MDGDNNNDPDLQNVRGESIRVRIQLRFFRQDRLMARLLTLINQLQPEQLNDPMRPELIFQREMEMDEDCIVNAYLAACMFVVNRRRLPEQDRIDFVQRFITGIDLIDNLFQMSLTEIERLEQQQ